MPATMKRTLSCPCGDSRPQKQAKHAGPAFDAVPTETNPLWIDDSEHSLPGSRIRSGPMPDLLARELTKPCHPASDDALRRDNAYYCCIASSVCGWTLKAWDRNLPRIYKHAGQCWALCNWRPALFQRAKSALASMAPGGFGEPDANVQDHSSPNDLTALHELPAPNPFLSYSHMGSMTLQDQLNHAVAALICASGAPA
ncbi:hypothetical protein RHS03_03462, partial [Rhizoctonia solani]